MKLLEHFIPFVPCTSDSVCTVCPLAKQHRLPFPFSTSVSQASFDLIHCDLWGPFNVKSHNNTSFFFTIVDDFSRFTWGFFVTLKIPNSFFHTIFLSYG
jgi:hypothetical protein